MNSQMLTLLQKISKNMHTRHCSNAKGNYKVSYINYILVDRSFSIAT